MVFLCYIKVSLRTKKKYSYCPLFISSFQESYSLIALFSFYGCWDVCKISKAWALFLLDGLPNKKKDEGKDMEAKVEEQHNIRA